MTRVLTGEIKPGLVVLLDDTKLREASDCMNSAWIAPGRSMPTEGDHYFLILKEKDEEGFFLSVHLHSEPGTQRDLMDGEKTGFVDQ